MYNSKSYRYISEVKVKSKICRKFIQTTQDKRLQTAKRSIFFLQKQIINNNNAILFLLKDHEAKLGHI